VVEVRDHGLDFRLRLAIICLSDSGDPREAGAADAATPVSVWRSLRRSRKATAARSTPTTPRTVGQCSA
jgi:hypothetical protein